MLRRLMQGVLLAVPLLFATAAFAAAPESESFVPSVVDKDSTDRFMNKVPPYAGGQPSPSVVMPTRAYGEYKNGPPSKMERKSSANQPPTPPAPPLSSSNLHGGTLERRTVTPVVITSPWK